MDWVHTYALVADQSACWVCTELSLSTSVGLLWRISPASVSNCAWLQNQWNSEYSLWNATWTDIYAGAKQQYDQPRLLRSYSTWDGSRWLSAEAMELVGPDPLCIENSKGQAQVGWTLDTSMSDLNSWKLLGGAEWSVSCSSHWDCLGGWPTWVALLVWKLDWLLDLGVV